MPLPDRIKRKDSITGIAIGVDGELILKEGDQIKFNWLYDGLWNQQTFNGRPVEYDKLSIQIVATPRKSESDPFYYDLDNQDIVFLKPTNPDLWSTNWESKDGKYLENVSADLSINLFAISDVKTEGSEIFDLVITHKLTQKPLIGDVSFFTETTKYVLEIIDTSRDQIYIGTAKDDFVDLNTFKLGWGNNGKGGANYISKFYAGKVKTDYPVYAVAGLGADFYKYDPHEDFYGAIRAICLSTDLDKLNNTPADQILESSRFGMLGDSIWTSKYLAVFAFLNTHTDITFSVSGKQRFHDVIQGLQTQDWYPKYDTVYLTNAEDGDAFFLHDTFSPYHSSVSVTTGNNGAIFAPRISGINKLFAGKGDDLIDLTTSESVKLKFTVYEVRLGEGNDILIGPFVEGYGEEGDDLFIAFSNYTTMNGGRGSDTFGLIPTYDERFENISISDFSTGEDKLKLYLSNQEIEKHSARGVNLLDKNNIKPLANGNISWRYFSFLDTWRGANNLYEYSTIINMNSRKWSVDDIEFVTYSSKLIA